MTKRECAHCGETYHAARLRAAKGYCSGRCRTAAHRAANAPTADHELTYGHIGQAPVHWDVCEVRRDLAALPERRLFRRVGDGARGGGGEAVTERKGNYREYLANLPICSIIFSS